MAGKSSNWFSGAVRDDSHPEGVRSTAKHRSSTPSHAQAQIQTAHRKQTREDAYLHGAGLPGNNHLRAINDERFHTGLALSNTQPYDLSEGFVNMPMPEISMSAQPQSMTWPLNAANAGGISYPFPHLLLPPGGANANFMSAATSKLQPPPVASDSLQGTAYQTSSSGVAGLGDGLPSDESNWRHDKSGDLGAVQGGHAEQDEQPASSVKDGGVGIEGCICGKPLRHFRCANVQIERVRYAYFCDTCVKVVQTQHTVDHLQNPLKQLFIWGDNEEGESGKDENLAVLGCSPPPQQAPFMPVRRVQGPSETRTSNLIDASAHRATSLRQPSPYARPSEAARRASGGRSKTPTKVDQESDVQTRGLAAAGDHGEHNVSASQSSDLPSPAASQIQCRKVLVCVACGHQAGELSDVLEHVGKKHEKQATFYESMEVSRRHSQGDI
ncbi:hypothetical protein PENSPDRAFT_667024 [Peniophora sp. CONT]|nr:hypothetical protein PENSPDRAFT_667024 [Peniophora sp. CONT]